jgi:hypothetical protein
MRTAAIEGKTVALTGDVNATTTIQIIGGAPKNLTSLTFNGKPLQFIQNNIGVVTATVEYLEPRISLPSLSDIEWRYKDSLPEIQPTYSDDLWVRADRPKTSNSLRNITTPTSLYGSEYGFHTGHLVYRGRFVAKGNETDIYLQTSGGSAYGMSAYLDTKFIGSFPGYDFASVGNTTFKLPALIAGSAHVITVVVDNMGLDENWVVGSDEMKNPRGILDYRLDGHEKRDIEWKITGNFGGETYADKTRGPLNEGGLWAERQGLHLPDPPAADWRVSRGPTEGIETAGIAWYVTRFMLDLPKGYDIPLSFVFTNATAPTAGSKAPAYRVQLYVNGWQFGKYVNNVGPQTKFPVPEGTFASCPPLAFLRFWIIRLTVLGRHLQLSRHQLCGNEPLGVGSKRCKGCRCQAGRWTSDPDGLRHSSACRESKLVGAAGCTLISLSFLARSEIIVPSLHQWNERSEVFANGCEPQDCYNKALYTLLYKRTETKAIFPIRHQVPHSIIHSSQNIGGSGQATRCIPLGTIIESRKSSKAEKKDSG